jgi:predicted DNA-binding transcriptional regulator YafY
MKAQRLLAITMLLLNRDCVSASELARRFEVSVRTIYRDFDALCETGIPIAAYPGAGGGYGIEQGFKIGRIRRAIEDRRLLSLRYVDGAGTTSSRRVEPKALRSLVAERARALLESNVL